jgi:hypothetical protein
MAEHISGNGNLAIDTQMENQTKVSKEKGLIYFNYLTNLSRNKRVKIFQLNVPHRYQKSPK